MTDDEKIARLTAENEDLRRRLEMHEQVAALAFGDQKDLRAMIDRYVPAELRRLVVHLTAAAHVQGEVTGRAWSHPPVILVPREPGDKTKTPG